MLKTFRIASLKSKSFKTFKINKNFKNFAQKVCVVDNPYTLEKYCEVPYLDDSQIPKVIENANSASLFLNSIPLEERISIVRHAMKWFKTNEKRVAEEISQQMGKPIIYARKEIDTMIDRAENLFKLAPEILKDETVLVDSTNYLKITKDPIGISLLISPWNYPLLTVVGGLTCSILCGNPVLIKHSIRTPLVGVQFEEAFKSVGALNVVQTVFLENEDIKKLYKVPELNYVGFTGSVETGKVVQSQIAKAGRFINTNFELGGKDAAYVREDADINFAVDNIVDGCMFNSGQSCCAVERVYVHSSKYDEFIDKSADLINKFYKLGNPLDESTNIGPMALPDAPLTLKEQVDEAVNNGAELLLGGSIVNDSNGKGRFFEPTLIKEVRNEMQIMQKESFGPLMPVCRVESDDEALDLINATEFGLTNAIYTKDYKNAIKLSKKIESGTVFMNRCDYLNPLLPFSGRKNSGRGEGYSKYGFAPFFKVKSLNFRLMN